MIIDYHVGNLRVPRRRKNNISNFRMSRSQMALPQIFPSISFRANRASKSSQLWVVLGQVNDNIGSVGSGVAADGAEVFFDTLRPDVFVAEDCFALAWLEKRVEERILEVKFTSPMSE